MKIDTILSKYEPKSENLIQILHDIQDHTEGNYLKEDDLEKVADYLKIPKSRVNGVVEFYSMFSKKPRGKYVIRLCKSPPCFVKGAFNMLDELKSQLEIDVNETTKDGLFTIETTSCLGVCDEAPVMSINNKIYGKLDSAKIKKIIENYRKGKSEI